MQSFDLYSEAWLVYILFGLALLFLIDLKLKKWRFVFRAGLLSLIAVGAFTPQVVNHSDSLAPIVLISILNAEVEGLSAIYQGLLTLLIIWGIVLALALAVKHFVDAQRKKPDSKAQQLETQQLETQQSKTQQPEA